MFDIVSSPEPNTLAEKSTRLRKERAALFHGLMMKGSREVLIVLESHRDNLRPLRWLKTGFWVTVVVTWGLGQMVLFRRRT